MTSVKKVKNSRLEMFYKECGMGMHFSVRISFLILVINFIIVSEFRHSLFHLSECICVYRPINELFILPVLNAHIWCVLNPFNLISEFTVNDVRP
jgi:hypothetical protein